MLRNYLFPVTPPTLPIATVRLTGNNEMLQRRDVTMHVDIATMSVYVFVIGYDVVERIR